jgi:hypothetical protein
MSRFLRSSATALCACALIALSAGVASADLKYAATQGSGGSYTSTIVNGSGTLYNGATGVFSSKISDTGNIGDNWSTLPGPAFQTFCVDIGHTNLSEVVDVANVSTFGGIASDNRDIGAAGYIVQTYADFGSAAWSSIIGSLSLTGVQLALINDSMKTAVVQTLVWAKAYGGVATSTVNNGNGAIQTVAQLLYGAIATESSGKTALVGFINYPPPSLGINGEKVNQDMLFAVPEPGSFAIAGFGALGFLAFGIRRRLKVATA